jgi:hypothetical protein
LVFLDFFSFPSSGILENTTFRKLDLFPSSGEGEELFSITGLFLFLCLKFWDIGLIRDLMLYIIVHTITRFVEEYYLVRCNAV